MVCGSGEALEFDHVDPESKLFPLTVGFSKYSLERLKEEARKCQLLCETHHAAKTRVDLGGKVPANKGRISHGKSYAARTLQCPCDPCAGFRRKFNKERLLVA